MEQELNYDCSATLKIFLESGQYIELIERELGVPSSQKYRKGDRRRPKSAPYKHDIWNLESRLNEEENRKRFVRLIT